MKDVVIKVENLSKQYRLGTVGTGTISHDLNRWWSKIRGKGDPTLKLGEINDRSQKGESEYSWALKDINLEVKRGEILGIIGRNGAGKSTLLKILSRVTAPTTGEVKIQGRLASLLEVGTGFHPELTGRENIFLNGAIMGMTKEEIKSKLEEIVDFSGCERYLDTPVKRYSSGMTVRLGFAVAAHLEPEILIVDEVLAVGDAEFQKKCIGKMKDVAGQGRTVLFVSHNMQAIKRLCDKCVYLKNGSVVQTGDTEEIISSYLSSCQNIMQNKSQLENQLSALAPDSVFKLMDISLTQNGNAVFENIENGSDLILKVEYEVFKETSGLRIYFDLVDSYDGLLFRSFNDEANDGDQITESGVYSTSMVLPKNLLAPSNYVLKICATIFNVRSLIKEPVTFALNVERTGLSNSAYLGDPIRGMLAPFFKWKTQKIIKR